MRPEGIIIVKCFFGSLAIDDLSGAAFHLYDKFSSKLLLSFIEGSNSDTYFYTHSDNKIMIVYILVIEQKLICS